MFPVTLPVHGGMDSGAGGLGKLTHWAHSALILLVGDLSAQLGALGIVIGVDAILGIAVAVQDKAFKAKTMLAGILKKLSVYFLLITLFNSADVIINTPDTLRWAALVTLLARETFSSLKHVDRLGYENLASSLLRIVEAKIPIDKRETKGKEAHKE